MSEMGGSASPWPMPVLRTGGGREDPGKAGVFEPEGPVAGVPELRLEKVLFSSANISQEKPAPRFDLILTPDDLNQTCENYSSSRAVRIRTGLQRR